MPADKRKSTDKRETIDRTEERLRKELREEPQEGPPGTLSDIATTGGGAEPLGATFAEEGTASESEAAEGSGRPEETAGGSEESTMPEDRLAPGEQRRTG